MSESIKTFLIFGYFKLFDKNGSLINEKYVTTESGEWRRIFWRFYLRQI